MENIERSEDIIELLLRIRANTGDISNSTSPNPRFTLLPEDNSIAPEAPAASTDNENSDDITIETPPQVSREDQDYHGLQNSAENTESLSDPPTEPDNSSLHTFPIPFTDATSEELMTWIDSHRHEHTKNIALQYTLETLLLHIQNISTSLHEANATILQLHQHTTDLQTEMHDLSEYYKDLTAKLEQDFQNLQEQQNTPTSTTPPPSTTTPTSNDQPKIPFLNTQASLRPKHLKKITELFNNRITADMEENKITLSKTLKPNEAAQTIQRITNAIYKSARRIHTPRSLQQFMELLARNLGNAQLRAIELLVSNWQLDADALYTKYDTIFEPFQDTEDKHRAIECKKQESRLLYEIILSVFSYNTTIRLELQTMNTETAVVDANRGILALIILKSNLEKMTLDAIVRQTMELLLYWTKITDFRSFKDWKLAKDKYTADYTKQLGPPQLSIIELCNTFLAARAMGNRTRSLLQFVKLTLPEDVKELIQQAPQVSSQLEDHLIKWEQENYKPDRLQSAQQRQQQTHHIVMQLLYGDTTPQTYSMIPSDPNKHTNDKCPYCNQPGHTRLQCVLAKQDKNMSDNIQLLSGIESRLLTNTDKIMQQLQTSPTRYPTKDTEELSKLLHKLQSTIHNLRPKQLLTALHHRNTTTSRQQTARNQQQYERRPSTNLTTNPRPLKTNDTTTRQHSTRPTTRQPATQQDHRRSTRSESPKTYSRNLNAPRVPYHPTLKTPKHNSPRPQNPQMHQHKKVTYHSNQPNTHNNTRHTKPSLDISALASSFTTFDTFDYTSYLLSDQAPINIMPHKQTPMMLDPPPCNADPPPCDADPPPSDVDSDPDTDTDSVISDSNTDINSVISDSNTDTDSVISDPNKHQESIPDSNPDTETDSVIFDSNKHQESLTNSDPNTDTDYVISDPNTDTDSVISDSNKHHEPNPDSEDTSDLTYTTQCHDSTIEDLHNPAPYDWSQKLPKKDDYVQRLDAAHEDPTFLKEGTDFFNSCNPANWQQDSAIYTDTQDPQQYHTYDLLPQLQQHNLTPPMQQLPIHRQLAANMQQIFPISCQLCNNHHPFMDCAQHQQNLQLFDQFQRQLITQQQLWLGMQSYNPYPLGGALHDDQDPANILLPLQHSPYAIVANTERGLCLEAALQQATRTLKEALSITTTPTLHQEAHRLRSIGISNIRTALQTTTSNIPHLATLIDGIPTYDLLNHLNMLSLPTTPSEYLLLFAYTAFFHRPVYLHEYLPDRMTRQFLRIDPIPTTPEPPIHLLLHNGHYSLLLPTSTLDEITIDKLSYIKYTETDNYLSNGPNQPPLPRLHIDATHTLWHNLPKLPNVDLCTNFNPNMTCDAKPCQKMKYRESSGYVHPFCSRTCANTHQARNSQHPTGRHTHTNGQCAAGHNCIGQGGRWETPDGHLHPYCGRTCAQHHQTLQQNPTSLFVRIPHTDHKHQESDDEPPDLIASSSECESDTDSQPSNDTQTYIGDNLDPDISESITHIPPHPPLDTWPRLSQSIMRNARNNTKTHHLDLPKNNTHPTTPASKNYKRIKSLFAIYPIMTLLRHETTPTNNLRYLVQFSNYYNSTQQWFNLIDLEPFLTDDILLAYDAATTSTNNDPTEIESDIEAGPNPNRQLPTQTKPYKTNIKSDLDAGPSCKTEIESDLEAMLQESSQHCKSLEQELARMHDALQLADRRSQSYHEDLIHHETFKQRQQINTLLNNRHTPTQITCTSWRLRLADLKFEHSKHVALFATLQEITTKTFPETPTQLQIHDSCLKLISSLPPNKFSDLLPIDLDLQYISRTLQQLHLLQITRHFKEPNTTTRNIHIDGNGTSPLLGLILYQTFTSSKHSTDPLTYTLKQFPYQNLPATDVILDIIDPTSTTNEQPEKQSKLWHEQRGQININHTDTNISFQSMQIYSSRTIQQSIYTRSPSASSETFSRPILLTQLQPPTSPTPSHKPTQTTLKRKDKPSPPTNSKYTPKTTAPKQRTRRSRRS